jgi:flagellar protein FlgJ
MESRIPDLALMNRLATSAPVTPKAGDKVADTARQFEALFVEQMLKTMRESSIGDGDALFPGQSALFREMHDREVVKSASQGQGFGLAPLIERSLRLQQAALEGRSAEAAVLTVPARGGQAYSLEGYARVLPAQRFDRESGARADAPSANLPRIPTQPPAPERSEPRAPEPGARPVPSADAPAGAAGPAATAKSTPEQFVERIWPYAQRAAQMLGVDPRMLVAQAALETGWGRHVPAAGDGEAGHNLFGIKAGRSWSGERASHLTQEFRDGRMQAERAEFRTYDSVEQSFSDYVALLRGSSRYAPALAAAGNNQAFASALQRAGYATDPQYAAKLTAIAHGPRLNRALAELQATNAPSTPPELAQNLQDASDPVTRSLRG